MKSVRGPSAIPAVADLWADLRIDMEPPAIKNLSCNRRGLRGVFRDGPTDLDLRIFRKSADTDEAGPRIPIVRLMFPNVNCGAVVNAALLM